MSLKYGKFPHDDFINIMTSGSRVDFFFQKLWSLNGSWLSEAAAKSVVAGLIQFFILLDFDFKVTLNSCVTYIGIEEVVTIRYAMESAATTSQARIFLWHSTYDDDDAYMRSHLANLWSIEEIYLLRQQGHSSMRRWG